MPKSSLTVSPINYEQFFYSFSSSISRKKQTKKKLKLALCLVFIIKQNYPIFSFTPLLQAHCNWLRWLNWLDLISALSPPDTLEQFRRLATSFLSNLTCAWVAKATIKGTIWPNELLIHAQHFKGTLTRWLQGSRIVVGSLRQRMSTPTIKSCLLLSRRKT